MSAAAHLAGLGLVLSIAADGRGLVIEGLQHMTLEARGHAVTLARENRLLILSEVMRRGGTLSNPLVRHYRSACPRYWKGCATCPDASLSKLDFCKRHPAPKVEVLK